MPPNLLITKARSSASCSALRPSSSSSCVTPPSSLSKAFHSSLRFPCQPRSWQALKASCFWTIMEPSVSILRLHARTKLPNLPRRCLLKSWSAASAALRSLSFRAPARWALALAASFLRCLFLSFSMNPRLDSEMCPVLSMSIDWYKISSIPRSHPLALMPWQKTSWSTGLPLPPPTFCSRSLALWKFSTHHFRNFTHSVAEALSTSSNVISPEPSASRWLKMAFVSPVKFSLNMPT
mmetsp:Transcript_4466/g.13041  ORF Transcript_4466/g.13041 Transcript_4466/m.13041 type:complete len:237 (+) Transcript_4466:2404-3114(+)